ncbi:MAG TPA: tetratricopeptide repeat protein [Candidatus Acidoferrum sp.]|nr:tetratricopeptide repeat protein [Candidatus Acidoferrum sp.]
MNATLRRIFLTFCLCSVGSTGVLADTNSAASPLSTEASNALLQIQQQLHDTQLVLEKNRQQTEAETRRNAEEIATRFESLQQIIAAQRQGEIEAVQKTQQMILLLGVSFGSVGLAALLLMAYLQWRAVSRLAELITLRQAEFALDQGRVAPALAAGAAVEQSNARLFAMVDQLEKRILELKQVARAPLAETNAPAAAPEANGAPKTSSDRDECVANLVAEGQALLAANEPQKALECFDVALGLHPRHAEALVKKGGALEKLGRLDEAITCYDQAIEADGGMTIAYLHKGGLYNRLSRYDEALQCYERALQTQEKKTPGEKIVA